MALEALLLFALHLKPLLCSGVALLCRTVVPPELAGTFKDAAAQAPRHEAEHGVGAVSQEMPVWSALSRDDDVDVPCLCYSLLAVCFLPGSWVLLPAWLRVYLQLTVKAEVDGGEPCGTGWEDPSMAHPELSCFP